MPTRRRKPGERFYLSDLRGLTEEEFRANAIIPYRKGSDILDDEHGPAIKVISVKTGYRGEVYAESERRRDAKLKRSSAA